MGSIKDKNFIVIQGWMINNLKLTGNDLIIYAIIYGFTQDEEQWFEGSRSYLAEWCNSTKRGIQKNLNRLVESKLIFKKEVFVNNVKFCKYKSNPKFIPGDPKYTPGEQSSLGVVNKVPWGGEQSSPGGGEQSSPNNIDIDNIDNNINIKKERKEERKTKKLSHTSSKAKQPSISFDTLIDNYTENVQLREELKEHLKVRKQKKGALTNRAIQLSLSKLDKIGADDYEKIKIVQNAIMNGWTGFFPLKPDEKKTMKKSNYDIEAYERSNRDLWESTPAPEEKVGAFGPVKDLSTLISGDALKPKQRKDYIDIEVNDE